MTISSELVPQLGGASAWDIDENEAGQVLEVLVDEADGHPVWAVIQHGDRVRVVPMWGASLNEDGVHLPYSGEAIEYGPTLEQDPAEVHEAPTEWNDYYGLRGAVGPDPAMDVPAVEEHLPRGLSGYSEDRPAAHAAAYAGGDSVERRRLRRHDFPEHPTGMDD